jgi:hypothetical protein
MKAPKAPDSGAPGRTHQNADLLPAARDWLQAPGPAGFTTDDVPIFSAPHQIRLRSSHDVVARAEPSL